MHLCRKNYRWYFLNLLWCLFYFLYVPISMLTLHLHDAGFFPIQWLPTAANSVPGRTFVRPSAKGMLRVFVPAENEQVELYAGSLTEGELRYRGPVPSESELRQLLVDAFSPPQR